MSSSLLALFARSTHAPAQVRYSRSLDITLLSPISHCIAINREPRLRSAETQILSKSSIKVRLTAQVIISDGRTGKNGRHALVGLLRQSVFGRLAGYEDVNDAQRLRHDPAMRWIVGGKAAQVRAASPSQMGRFETQWLAAPENLSALSDLSGQWIDLVHGRRSPRGIVLDMDSSVSPRGPGPRRRVKHRGLPMRSRTGSKKVPTKIPLSRGAARLQRHAGARVWPAWWTPMGVRATVVTLHGYRSASA